MDKIDYNIHTTNNRYKVLLAVIECNNFNDTHIKDDSFRVDLIKTLSELNHLELFNVLLKLTRRNIDKLDKCSSMWLLGGVLHYTLNAIKLKTSSFDYNTLIKHIADIKTIKRKEDPDSEDIQVIKY